MSNIDKKVFSQNLKRLMEKNNVKNIDLAKKLKITKPAISNYTTGRSVPKIDVIFKIAEIFGVHVESLLNKNYEAGKIMQSNIKINKSEKSTSFNESDPNEISYYQVPMFINKLYSSDIIYVNNHYCDKILSTFSFYGDYECYAVRVGENNIAALPVGTVAIFAATLKAENGELAAVLYKEDLKILLRRVEFLNDYVILKTDKTEEKYKYNSRNCPVFVLGKVVNITISLI